MKKTLLILIFGMIVLVSSLASVTGYCPGDINIDGSVDDSDLSLVIANWNQDITYKYNYPPYNWYHWPGNFMNDDALSFILAHFGDKC